MYDSAIEGVYDCGGNDREALTSDQAGVLYTYAPTNWGWSLFCRSNIASNLGWPILVAEILTLRAARGSGDYVDLPKLAEYRNQI
jgi:hypothetical protein